MYGSRPRYVGGHLEWPSIEPYGPPGWNQYGPDAAGASYLGVGAVAPYAHAPFSHHPPDNKATANLQQLVNNKALLDFVGACSSMGLCNAPFGPSPVSPGLLEQVTQNFPALHGPGVTGHQQEMAHTEWRSNADRFLSRESDFRDSGLSHRHGDSSVHGRGYVDTDSDRMGHDHLESSGSHPASVKQAYNEESVSVKGVHHDTSNRLDDKNEIPPLFRRDPKPRDSQEFTERCRNSRKRSREGDYGGGRERDQDRESYGGGQRPSHPEPERMNYLGQSSHDVHRRRPDYLVQRDSRGSDLNDFERHSHLPPSHQSHGYHSPPPIRDLHPPERHPRRDEDPFVVEERLRRPPLPPPHPFHDSERFRRPPPPPPHGLLADRFGESPATMAHSLQARLGPPRITEPLDRNQGIVPFNTPSSHRLRVSEPHTHAYPLPDLRQELGNHNAMPPPPMESSFPRTVSPYSSIPGPRDHSPPFRRPSSPGRRLSPPARRQMSPVRGPPLPSRRSLSPSAYPPLPPRRSPSPVRHPSPPSQRPPSPLKRPPSPVQCPQTPPVGGSSSLTESPTRANTSSVKDVPASSRQPQSSAAKSKSPLRRKSSEENLRNRHSSGPTSPSLSHVRSKGQSSSPRRTRHSSGCRRSSASDTDSKIRTSSPKRRSGRSRSPSPSRRRSPTRRRGQDQSKSPPQQSSSSPSLKMKRSPRSRSSPKTPERQSSGMKKSASSNSAGKKVSLSEKPPSAKQQSDSLPSAKTEQQCVSSSVHVGSTSVHAHPLHQQRVASTASENISVARPKQRDTTPPLSSSLPPDPPHGEQRDLSHDHHGETSRFKIDLKLGNMEVVEREFVGLSSSLTSSPSTTPACLMQIDLSKPSTVPVGISVSGDGMSSQNSSPSSQSFVLDLESSHRSTFSNGMAPALAESSNDLNLPPFPPPLPVSGEDTLPFSNFLDSLQRPRRITVCSADMSDGQLENDVIDVDSDNEGALVIDESFTSVDEIEASPKHDKIVQSSESMPAKTTPKNQNVPESDDIQVSQDGSKSSISTCSLSQSDASISDAEHSSTPKSTVSSMSSTSQTAKASEKNVLEPASQRVRRVAASVIGSSLVMKLVRDNNNDLLRRLFKAVVLVTECLKWKLRSKTDFFFRYFPQIFSGFVTATLTTRHNTPLLLFRKELQALKPKCGSDVSRWKEQIQRFVLLANTLPKDKKELGGFVRSKQSMVFKTVSAVTMSECPVNPTEAPQPSSSGSISDEQEAKVTSSNSAEPGLSSERTTNLCVMGRRPPPVSATQSNQTSAFTPIVSKPSSSVEIIPSSETLNISRLTVDSTSSATSSVGSPTRPVTIISGQAPSTGSTTSCLFKPVAALATPDVSSNVVKMKAFPKSGDRKLNPQAPSVQSKPANVKDSTCLSSAVKIDTAGNSCLKGNVEPTCSTTSMTSLAKKEGSNVRDRSLSPGEIVSSSPSPEPEPENSMISSVVPLAYSNPERWKRLDSHERELRRGPRRRSRSPEWRRSHRRMSRRMLSGDHRSRSRDRRSSSRGRRSWSHGRRSWSRSRRSWSRDRRSRSRDRRSRSRDGDRDWRRLRLRSRSPRHKIDRRKSRDQRNQSPGCKRRSSRAHGERSVDSEDELEVLKREALASMKPTAESQQSKTTEAVRSQPEKIVAQRQSSHNGVVTDSGRGGEIDMDICSISSEDGGNIDARDTSSDSGAGKALGTGQGTCSIDCGVATGSGDSVENASTRITDSAEVVQSDEGASSGPLSGKDDVVQTRDVQSHASVEVSAPVVAVQQPVGRSVSAPGSRVAAKQGSIAPPSVKVVKKSPQTPVGVASPLASKAIVSALKKSLSRPTSHSGSKSNSPALSPTHSHVPSPSGSIESEGLPSDRVRHRSGSCVKVLPSNKATWDIQQLLIVNDGVGSESDSECSSVSDAEDIAASRSPELSDISKLLLKAKAVAEENANSEIQKKQGSRGSLQLPLPPSSLTSAQKMEYLELHRKLALHAKKKNLGTTAASAATKSSFQAQGKPKDKQPASPPTCRPAMRDKLLPRSGVEPVSRKSRSAKVEAIRTKARSNSEPSVMMTRQRETDTIGKGERKSRKSTGPVRVESVGAKVSASEEKIHSEMEPEEFADETQQQTHQLMVKTTVAGQKSEENMRQKQQRVVLLHRRTVEECQRKLTTLTHQLTEAVSDIEELELKTENLKKALQTAERQLKEKEQERCDLQLQVRQTKETIATTNATIGQLEREVTLEEKQRISLFDRSASPGTTILPQYDDVSYIEVTTKELSPITEAFEPTTSTAKVSAETLHEMDYKMTSDIESVGSTANALQPSENSVVIIVEPVSESEEQVVVTKMTRDPSPLRVELVSDAESDQEQRRNCVGGEMETERVADASVHQTTPQSPMQLLSQVHSYSAAFDAHVAPAIPMLSPPHVAADRKTEESHEKGVTADRNTEESHEKGVTKQPKRLKTRSTSTSSMRTRQTGNQLPRELSLLNSPKRISPSPTDQYISLLPQSVTCSETPAESGSLSKALSFSTDDQPASSGDRVPEILTDLITCLNTEIMHSGALSSPTSSASSKSILGAPLTAPATSVHQGDSSSNRVDGILTELVTYLTTETIQNTAVAVADLATESSAESAVHQLMDIETCDSPFSVLTDSENVYATDCEASAESENDEGPREREERRGYQYIDVDSLFIPCSNPLFSIGEDQPPLFLLPRVACAEDFPLEVEPHCISRVALEAAQQVIIHAPQRIDLSTRVQLMSREVSGGNSLLCKEGEFCLAELSDGGVECKATAEENLGSGISQTPLSTKRPSTEQSLAHPTEPLTPMEQEQAPPTEPHPSTKQPLSSGTLPSAKQVLTRLKTPPTKPHPSRSENVAKEPPPTKKRSTSSTKSRTLSQKATIAVTKVTSAAVGGATGKVTKVKESVAVGGVTGKVAKVTKGDSVAVGGATSKVAKITMGDSVAVGGATSKVAKITMGGPSRKVLKVAKGVGGVAKKIVQGKKRKGSGKLHLQLEEHMARLEELKGHLASKSSSQPSTSISTGADVPSDARASVKATKSGVPVLRKRKKSTSFGSVKKSAVSATSADSEELFTCARTSGFVHVKKPLASKLRKGRDNKGTDSVKVPSTGHESKSPASDQMSDIFDVVLAGTGTRPSSLDDLHTRLGQLWQSNQCLLLDTALEPHPFPAASTIPSCGLAMAIPRLSATGKVSADVENLTKPKKHVSLPRLTPSDRQPSLQRSCFRPYSSPLLMFQSYRLNALYRTNEKLGLHSLSHSNKIDPNKIMCRFELGGICNDSSCTGQHFRDIRLNKEELIQDLVSYAPQLAGCTVNPADGEGLAERHLQGGTETAKEMIASYASQMVNRYSSKVPDEDLFKLTVHDVNKERAKLKSDPKANATCSYVSFDDGSWLACKGGSSKPLSVKHAISLLADETVTSQLGEGKKSEIGMEWDDISKELMPVSGYGHEASSQKHRYFSVTDESVPSQPQDTDSSTVAPSVEAILQSVAAVRSSGQGAEPVMRILSEGLRQHKASEDLWVEYLRVSCCEVRHAVAGGAGSSATTSTDTGVREKNKTQLFDRAMMSSNSYRVGFECIRMAEGYEMKSKCTRKLLQLLTKLRPEPHPVSSHQCLELLVNMCLLDQLRGRPASETIAAIKTMHNYEAVLAALVCEDLMLLCLTYIHMTATGMVPVCLLATPTSGHTHPAKLASKEPFVVEWSKMKRLSLQEYNILFLLFEECLVLCLPDGSSTLDIVRLLMYKPGESSREETPSLPTPSGSSLVRNCLPLFQNLALFEAAHGDVDKAVALVGRCVSACPKLTQLWMLYARVLEDAGRDSDEVMSKATQECPKSAELFYLAARLSLTHHSKDTPTASTETALQWLQCCVSNFYEMSAGSVTDPEQAKVLYRRLLCQMIPYDLQLPEFADGVDPSNLGSNQAPLWLCYCLLVELTLPSSTSSPHSEFHHCSVEEAFESAIHCVHAPPSAVQSLWMEYLLYLRSKSLEEDDSAYMESFRAFSGAVHRCLMAVDYVKTLPSAGCGDQQSQCTHDDYSFHDQVIDVFSSVLHPNSTCLLSQLQKFHVQLPRSPVLVARLVRCALAQQPVREDLSQTALATYLANNPDCHFLWRMAGALEQKLGNVREARWIYHQAVRVSPSNAHLWKDFLLFELKESPRSRGLVPSLSVVNTLLQKAKLSGIDLWQAVKDHSLLTN